MKSVVTVLSVLLFVSVVSAQNPLPASTARNPHDSMQQSMNCPGMGTGPMAGQMGKCCPGSGKQMFPGHSMNFLQDNRGPGCDEMRYPCFGKTHRRMCGLQAMRCCPPPLCCGIMFIGILLWGIINILLTIIVSLDMTKNGRFNGLWIPVLLIAGIPGSIIYALFRIGDKIPCKGA
jgi:hypothetical protein